MPQSLVKQSVLSREMNRCLPAIFDKGETIDIADIGNHLITKKEIIDRLWLVKNNANYYSEQLSLVQEP